MININFVVGDWSEEGHGKTSSFTYSFFPDKETLDSLIKDGLSDLKLKSFFLNLDQKIMRKIRLIKRFQIELQNTLMDQNQIVLIL